MQPSLHALLSEIVDYAGLFPPARLELDAAIGNYARYRSGPYAWMLGKFVCPAARLADLLPCGETLFSPQTPLRLAVLGRGGETGEAFFAALRADIEAIARFRRQAGAWARVEALELALPGDLCRAADSGAMSEFLIDVEQSFAQQQAEAILPDFYELTITENWREALHAAARGFSDYCRGGGRAVLIPAGIKLRCGGPDASAVPSTEQVTTYIEVCRDRQVPLKFTAGLHHPYRHLDPALRTHAHGFLNLFIAGVLAYALRLSHHDIRAVVEELDPRQFHYSESFVGWVEADASTDEVRYARQHCVISFGSCSFDEPCEELRAFGLLD